MDEEKNTNVYVSGLPSDITDDEYKEMMTKYGLVMFDPISKSPKLKLYKDENGEPKGDGRCCYIKLESVDLALKLLDGYNLRGSTIHVEKAKFTMKGEFDPSKKRKKLSNKEKKKMKEKQQKLFDWRPERAVGGRKKGDKVVILKNMFKPTDFDEDPMLINELRDDVRTEASKFGEVKNVKIFDNHPEGVMSVSFKEPEEADACISAFNGRWFDKKVITAESWDGRTKYEIQESEAERDARLNKWEKFLENDEKKNSNSSESSNETEKETNSQQSKRTEAEEAGASDMSPQKTRDEAGSTSTSDLPSITTGGASGSDHSTPS
ncbi:hypothetical protein FSP39_013131 [Pinctada imbricata]|uniref:17S U2 SnRNP complex component HTATSF1 n=1 Tax=Pinctada imbricata TaxID=66713 RepID=A0AA88Y925_PINIB|nr:hypothetical protein FSP39_013131 [Pinctada imbricata]